MSDFDSASGYAWLIAHSDSLSGFNAANVSIDASGFTNRLGVGSFSLNSVGNDVCLNFTPGPEPATYLLLASGLALVVFGRRRSLRPSGRILLAAARGLA